MKIQATFMVGFLLVVSSVTLAATKKSDELTPGTTTQIGKPAQNEQPVRTPKPHKNKKAKRLPPEQSSDEYVQ